MLFNLSLILLVFVSFLIVRYCYKLNDIKMKDNEINVNQVHFKNTDLFFNDISK